MSGEGSESSNYSESEFDSRVFKEQIPYLQRMYGSAENLFNQTNQQIQGQQAGLAQDIEGVRDTTQPFWEQQLGGGSYQDMGLQNSLMNSLNQSFNNPSDEQSINSMIMGGSGNNYADAMKNQYTDDANRATDSMLANMDARATASGMSGGSRHGTAIARGMDDINRNLQRNLAETGYNTFDKDLDRKLGIAQRADANTFGRQGMLQDMIGSQQSVQNLGLGSGASNQNNLSMDTLAPTMAPWQAMGQYSGAIGNPQVLASGSSMSSGDSKSSGGGIGG